MQINIKTSMIIYHRCALPTKIQSSIGGDGTFFEQNHQRFDGSIYCEQACLSSSGLNNKQRKTP